MEKLNDVLSRLEGKIASSNVLEVTPSEEVSARLPTDLIRYSLVEDAVLHARSLCEIFLGQGETTRFP